MQFCGLYQVSVTLHNLKVQQRKGKFSITIKHSQIELTYYGHLKYEAVANIHIQIPATVGLIIQIPATVGLI